jgi:hypothetical protein
VPLRMKALGCDEAFARCMAHRHRIAYHVPGLCEATLSATNKVLTTWVAWILPLMTLVLNSLFSFQVR